MARKRNAMIKRRNTLIPVSKYTEPVAIQPLTQLADKCYDNYGKEKKCDDKEEHPDPSTYILP